MTLWNIALIFVLGLALVAFIKYRVSEVNSELEDMDTPSVDSVYPSEWSNNIYPCSKCDFIGPLDAFTHGECYKPCPKCGGERNERTGRFWFRKVRGRRHFVSVEWRDEK